MNLVKAQRVSAVAKKQTAEQDTGPGFERIEFQAPVGTSDKIDAAAKQLGLSRSAYIRQAVFLQLKRDASEYS